MLDLRGSLHPLTRVPGVKGCGRWAVRHCGIATASWRPAPDFLLIGAKRAGTTSMFRHLLRHPQMMPLFPSARRLPLGSDMKGVHYFDTGWERGEAWYRSHFPTRAARERHARELGENVVTGEASPYYLFHPLAARRAAATLPDVKIVVMLRDPVARAHSHWREQRRNGVETLSFPDAVAAEQRRTGGEEARLAREPGAVSFAHEHQGYLRQSEYSDGLRRWAASYPDDRIHVVWSDHFYADAQGEFDEVCRFLGIRPRPLADARVWNAAPSGAELDAGLARSLYRHFAPFDAELGQMLGRRVPWRR